MRLMKLLTEVQGHYSKEQLAQREEAKKELFNQTELATPPPEWLPMSAKTEWKRLVPLLKEDMPITEMDYSLLVAYVCAYARIKTAENDIRKNGTIQTTENSNGTKTRKANPAVAIQSQASKDLKSLATSLGITLEARQRLALNKAKEKAPEDPFMQLMANG